MRASFIHFIVIASVLLVTLVGETLWSSGYFASFKSRTFAFSQDFASPEYRKDAAKRRFQMALKAAPKPFKRDDPDGLAIIILMRRELSAPNVWERWIQDAYDWMDSQGLEDPSIKKPQSNVLRFYTQASSMFDLGVVKAQLPPLLKGSLIMQGSSCADTTDLNRCHRRLLEYAHMDFTNAAYFLVLSETAVPMKSFAAMYEDLAKDTRIRTQVEDMCFTDTGLPKTSGMKGLSRSHVAIFLNSTDWGTTDPTMVEAIADVIGQPLECALDSCEAWAPLYDTLGEALFEDFIVNEAYPNGDFASFVSQSMVECNEGHSECASSGEWEGATYLYKRVSKQWVDSQIQDPQVWFGRKYLDETEVIGEKSMVDYLAQCKVTVSTPAVQSKSRLHDDFERGLWSLNSLMAALEKAARVKRMYEGQKP
eukprot:Blabericola_migrator_1__5010@NODE_25_length_21156_cov_56_925364_g22_i0_p4_GENE_NODE_25_length_21156_cov_56_925364_g22_i0NODE_25_length_21156_cov_56_925364_g22_i0_p4_ORF_typecomplete_len423_score50_97Branch/PF02485_21/2_5e05_NODE_25_length_21156_cov_56_925364_g22_i01298814256